jgi:hypothetical protein
MHFMPANAYLPTIDEVLQESVFWLTKWEPGLLPISGANLW